MVYRSRPSPDARGWNQKVSLFGKRIYRIHVLIDAVPYRLGLPTHVLRHGRPTASRKCWHRTNAAPINSDAARRDRSLRAASSAFSSFAPPVD
jgi:hypothetical protein